jgi:hypothetical protein
VRLGVAARTKSGVSGSETRHLYDDDDDDDLHMANRSFAFF